MGCGFWTGVGALESSGAGLMCNASIILDLQPRGISRRLSDRTYSYGGLDDWLPMCYSILHCQKDRWELDIHAQLNHDLYTPWFVDAGSFYLMPREISTSYPTYSSLIVVPCQIPVCVCALHFHRFRNVHVQYPIIINILLFLCPILMETYFVS